MGETVVHVPEEHSIQTLVVVPQTHFVINTKIEPSLERVNFKITMSYPLANPK